MINPYTGKRMPQVNNDRICRFNVREIDAGKYFKRGIIRVQGVSSTLPLIKTVQEVLK